MDKRLPKNNAGYITGSKLNKKRFFLLAVLLFTLLGPAFAFAEDLNVPAEAKNQSSRIEPEKDKKDPAAIPEKPAPEEQKEGLPSWAPKFLGAQFNGIYQEVPGFHSPYEGINSFRREGRFGHNGTHAYGVYLGSQITDGLQGYVDIEMVKGIGVSAGLGLGGYVNGDVIKVGNVNLGNGPYVARAYLRYFYALSPETTDMERGQDQLLGKEPVSRIEVKAGKMSVSDDFDLNRYANNTRTQFMNYDFISNTAWDYAGDTRAYSYGFVASLFQPTWRLAFGSYAQYTFANGSTVDTQIFRAQGNNLELTLKPNEASTVIRALAYLNQARMGIYDEAVAIGREANTIPDIRADDRPGRVKYGFGLNFEQPIADNGETGIFGRIGWNDGSKESWSFTEVDRTASLGLQVNGAHWFREADQMGIGYAINAISSGHRDYLAAGGTGLLLGDGRLNYGTERIAEVYYRVQLGRYAQLSPDFQYIENPGYNRDRGPAVVYGMRLRLSI